MTGQSQDEAGELRDEDAFDAARMHEWLSAHVPGLAGPPEVRQFERGASNLTYLLRYPGRDLILRRPPVGHKAASAHDMGREYRVQRALRPQFPYVPRMLAFCDDPSVIGSDFYVMERLDGIILRGDPPESVDLGPEKARALSTALIDRLVELHSVDPAQVGLDDLGKGAGYIARQVEGWAGRHDGSRTPDTTAGPRIIEWLRQHQPAEERICLIHNDYRLDNVVLESPQRLEIKGVLDWEMATLGDPLMDLGGTMSYWVQADDDEIMLAGRRQPTHLSGMLSRAEAVDHYSRRTGIPVRDWTFYEVFGLFRYAVIAQQIYYRYYHGQTHNPAFAHMGRYVDYLIDRCHRRIAD